MATNLSAVLHKKKDLKLEEMPLPGKPGPHDAKIEIHSVGICGSDVHYYNHGYIGPYVVKEPMILGHESSGTVVEVGAKVKHLKKGDRVALEPGVPCRVCDYCKVGKYNLCPDIFFFATPPDHGSLTKYVNHAADFCFKLPDHISYEEGAFLEPLSVAVYACQRSQVKLGDVVLVSGAGPIGLLSMLTAKAFGASKVCITSTNPGRLEFAKKLGAEIAVQIDRNGKVEDMVAQVKEALGQAPDVTIECAGAENSIQLSLLATKSGGVVSIVGCGPETMTLPLLAAVGREVDVRGCFRYRNCYPPALELIASGRLDVKPLITHRFTLDQAVEAFETANSKVGVKIMIKVAEN